MPAPRWLLAGMLAALLGCSTPAPIEPALPALPEGASGTTSKPGWTARRMMVAAANPLAAQAGFDILKAGGNAIDAAIAVQMVLSLVEPQSSGIGGGAFLMFWDGRGVQAWDGRETAPAEADESLFLQADGKPMPMQQAVVGGRAVGVPGVVRMLEAVHRQQGKLPWARLFEPAIILAEQGFSVSPRMHTQLKTEVALRSDPLARSYFFGLDGQPRAVGERLQNPALAAVLRTLAREGADGLHRGRVAEDIVARVRGHPTNPGRLSIDDLAGYRPLRRDPICTDWLSQWRVCGFPPPSSGHLTMMQILGLIERSRPVGAPLVEGIPGPEWLHVYTEAARLAFADRNQYIADPAFVSPPVGRWTALLDDAYLRQRAGQIGEQSMKTARPGSPGGQPIAWGTPAPQPENGTSHVSIVDPDGRAVAMTTTIEAVWGARLMSDGGTGLAGGFLLNNQLTDFSMLPADAEGRPVANRVQAGKRPRSSMSPTLVFDRSDGRLAMTLGSPGGAAIIHFTAKALIGTLGWGLSPQAAIDLPNFGSYNGPTQLEAGRFPASTPAALRGRGHVVVEADMTSGLQAIRRLPAGWLGGADPRREGIAVGE